MKNCPGYKRTPNLSVALWAVANFFTLSFAEQEDAPCPVIVMQLRR